ncbi:serine hydrolase [Roseomonas sp. OT10]|uniref:serine hydrolase domain-containing protein n=1 Tax=Roseomonas cutis TaxID=2897332 RepID=UPI001E371085|nr:serine hydrolase [Roseomonas sp. OT10]UFN48027.1 serine hydrolase [Roseomonas sp. OT10]
MTGLDLTLIERRVEALLAPWATRPGPGATLGIVLDGELAVRRHAGLASVEHGVPIGPGTCFRIASVSKQFTCAAILMLAEEGKLSLEDEARSHLPELPELSDRITVAQLMHNSSGIRDMLEIMRHGGADLGTPVRPEDLLAGICRQRTLNFTPGTRFLYSNSNFLLLGLIVERVSGESLRGFLDRRIFAPLGMRDTRMTESVQEAVPGLATGYFGEATTGWSRAPHAFPLHGEGGLVSSVQDLALWDRNFTTRRVGGTWLDGLDRQTPFANGTENRYARGLVVRPYRGLRTVSHGGLWPGYRTEFLRVPEQGVTVIAIANLASIDPNLLAHRALDAVLDGRPGIHPVPALPKRAALAGLEGRYRDPETDTTLEIGFTEAGAPTLTLNGMMVVAEATEDGRLASPRSSSVFTLRAAGPDAVEVEQDAGVKGLWHRVPPGAALPEGLAGTYRSEETDAVWTVLEKDGKTWVQSRGPVAVGPLWEVEAIEGDLIRVHTPGTLWRIWLDVRVQREGGTIAGLLASGGRVKRMRYRRE